MGYRTTRHPILKQYAVPGQWCREAAEVGVPGYPRTEEAWRRLRDHLARGREDARARGLLHHTGVPHGWAGQGEALAEIREVCHVSASKMVRRIEGWDEWDDRAQLALTEVLAIALNPSSHIENRLAALKVVLEYTQPMPTGRLDVALREYRRPGSNQPPLTSTEWLERLAETSGAAAIVRRVKGGD